jgi:hypothetical protein
MTQEYDISFIQGDTFSETWVYGSSLSGFTARMKIKDDPQSESVLELTSSSGITLSGSNITVDITAAQSSEIEGGIYLYDLRLISAGGVVSTFRKGYVEVVAQISDDD